MNCKSIARLFGVLYRRYSSKMDVSDHDWIRRRQPTTQPVRCCLGAGERRQEGSAEWTGFVRRGVVHTLPLLQWINIG